jgi:predicted AlkP superfamily pyrophosphatase or phosphodiesterase
MENEGLGKDEITDYLLVSFSSTDYVGHVFGPSSLEAEDNLIFISIVGIALAISSRALATGSVRETLLMQSILKNFNPSRSGDIFVVFEPNRFINDFNGLTVTATHGSPWRYDTHVPIIFAGMGIPAQPVARKVHTVDIAPTLSLIVGAKPPSGSFGEVLSEVLGSVHF